MTVTNEQEQVVCDFLRKLCPSRDWMYLGEVEHLWVAEMVGAITATVGAWTCELVNAADDLGEGTSSCMCSKCGYTAFDDWWDEFKHCPNCGARIKEEAG